MDVDYEFPDALCGAKLPDGTTNVLLKDSFGNKCSFISADQHRANIAKLNSMMDVYYEFPALWTDCKSRRPALLGSDPAILEKLGLPHPLADIWNYGHLFPAFVELRPAREMLAPAPPPPEVLPQAEPPKQMESGSDAPAAPAPAPAMQPFYNATSPEVARAPTPPAVPEAAGTRRRRGEHCRGAGQYRHHRGTRGSGAATPGSRRRTLAVEASYKKAEACAANGGLLHRVGARAHFLQGHVSSMISSMSRFIFPIS